MVLRWRTHNDRDEGLQTLRQFTFNDCQNSTDLHDELRPGLSAIFADAATHLKVPIPAIPIPALDVPYAAPMVERVICCGGQVHVRRLGARWLGWKRTAAVTPAKLKEQVSNGCAILQRATV